MKSIWDEIVADIAQSSKSGHKGILSALRLPLYLVLAVSPLILLDCVDLTKNRASKEQLLQVYIYLNIICARLTITQYWYRNNMRKPKPILHAECLIWSERY